MTKYLQVRPHFTPLEPYEMPLGSVTTVADLGHQAADMIDLTSADLTSLATPEQLAATNAGATLQV